MKLQIDPALVVPDPTMTLKDGAIAPWSKTISFYYLQTLEAVVEAYGHDMRTPFKDLPDKVQQAILYGSGSKEIEFIYQDVSRTYKTKKPFEGVIPNLERRMIETESANVREDISRYQGSYPCEA